MPATRLGLIAVRFYRYTERRILDSIGGTYVVVRAAFASTASEGASEDPSEESAARRIYEPALNASCAGRSDANCAGGVMNLPPKLVGNAFVIGHELLHLFGLMDRYMMTTSVPDKGHGTPVTQTIPTRETQGRRDPLGGQAGPILNEDLAFLFERLGVYDKEENHGLDVLRTMEREGMSINAVIAEINRLEEIVKLGRDPRSLIEPPKDFNRNLTHDIEQL